MFSRRERLTMWLGGLVLVAGFVWLLVLGVRGSNSYASACTARGGHVEQRFVMMIPVGKVLVPQYRDQCVVNGRDVDPQR